MGFAKFRPVKDGVLLGGHVVHHGLDECYRFSFGDVFVPVRDGKVLRRLSFDMDFKLLLVRAEVKGDAENVIDVDKFELAVSVRKKEIPVYFSGLPSM